MEEVVQQPKTITIDNAVYEIDALPENVKALLVVHQEWSADLRTQRLAFAKTEAALRDLVREIIAGVKAAVPAAAPEAAEAPAAPAAE